MVHLSKTDLTYDIDIGEVISSHEVQLGLYETSYFLGFQEIMLQTFHKADGTMVGKQVAPIPMKYFKS